MKSELRKKFWLSEKSCRITEMQGPKIAKTDLPGYQSWLIVFYLKY